MYRSLVILLVALWLTACGGAAAQPEASGGTPTPDSNTVGDAMSPTNAAAVATIEASPIQESGTLVVPFAAGAREYLYSFTLPAHWRGRYALNSDAENALTFAYLPSPEQSIPVFTLVAKPTIEWNAVPSNAVEVMTLEEISFGYQPGDAAAIQAAGADAIQMLADLPAIFATLEIRRNTEPGG